LIAFKSTSNSEFTTIQEAGRKLKIMFFRIDLHPTLVVRFLKIMDPVRESTTFQEITRGRKSQSIDASNTGVR